MAGSGAAKLGRAPERGASEDSAILLRLATGAVAFGTWRWALPSGPAWLDESAGRLLGLPAESALAPADLLAAFPGKDREAIGQAVTEAPQLGGFTLEARLGHAENPAPIRVRLTAAFRRGQEGGAARLLGVVAPLPPREDPRLDPSHFAALVASSEDAIIGNSLGGRVVSWNPAAERLFGYTAEEMLGKPVTVLAPPGYEDDMPGMLARIRAGARVEHYESWRRRKDGTLVRVSLTVSPIHDESGALVGASKVVRDITAAHRTAEALRGAEERLAALEQELMQVSRMGAFGQMAAMLAHELNQPLTAITNYTVAARRLLAGSGAAAIPRALEALDRVSEQASRSGQTIRALRGFAARAPFERKPEALGPIIEEAARLALRAAEGSGVRVQLHLDPGCPAVMADRMLILQVALNLIQNAAEAMAPLARQEMLVTAGPRDGMVEVAVSDTGTGIAPEVAAQLFQPFVSTKRGGGGSGLPICRSIVEAHGGQLWMEENPDGGTTFRFTLQPAPG